MKKELFSMKIVERRTVDGDFKSRKFNYNRRKSDKLEDNNLYKLMESVYMLNGVLFTDSFEIISENIQKCDYLDIEYNSLQTDDKNYIVQNGTFVVVLSSLYFFEDSSFDKNDLDDIISNVDSIKVDMFLYNGSWWVNKDQAFVDVEYKRIQEENTILEDLKDMPK